MFRGAICNLTTKFHTPDLSKTNYVLTVKLCSYNHKPKLNFNP